MIKVSFSAEPVEKVQPANFIDFDIGKNQQLMGHRKLQNGRIYGFSTGSPYLICFLDHQKLSI
jgi:hypothetical protein